MLPPDRAPSGAGFLLRHGVPTGKDGPLITLWYEFEWIR